MQNALKKLMSDEACREYIGGMCVENKMVRRMDEKKQKKSFFDVSLEKPVLDQPEIDGPVMDSLKPDQPKIELDFFGFKPPKKEKPIAKEKPEEPEPGETEEEEQRAEVVE